MVRAAFGAKAAVMEWGVTLDARSTHAATPASLEANLVERALAGDGRAFSALVSPHLSLLYRVARRVAGDDAVAEDAVQESLTIVFRQLRRYRAGTSFRAFVASIATKRAHTLIRSERRRRRYEEQARGPSPLARPDEWTDAEEAATKIRALLAKMPKKRRAAAILRLDGGLAYAEIAEAIGSSEAAARVHVHNALKTLRAELGAWIEAR